MFLPGGLLSRLDILLQKFTRYNHHQKNYERSLLEGIVTTGLRLKKHPVFQPVPPDFDLNWNVLHETEKKLVKLYAWRIKKVITKIDTDIAIEVETKYPEATREKSKTISSSTKMLNGNCKWSVKRDGKSLDLERLIKINKIKQITQRHHFLN